MTSLLSFMVNSALVNRAWFRGTGYSCVVIKDKSKATNKIKTFGQSANFQIMNCKDNCKQRQDFSQQLQIGSNKIFKFFSWKYLCLGLIFLIF